MLSLIMSGMQKTKIRTGVLLPLILSFLLFSSLSTAEIESLKIISSSNPDSNKSHSFIHVANSLDIVQGVKKNSVQSALKFQIPFVIDLPIVLKEKETMQWLIKTQDKYIGDVEILSKFKFTKESDKAGFLWVSPILKNNIEDHSRLVFRPKPLKHEQGVYKKGRGGNGKRQRFGGGTPKIDEMLYNPRLSYSITAKVVTVSGGIRSYKGKIEMDNKDMVRQEYINHFKINRYGRGGYGNLPVPMRNEISSIPSMPKNLLGNGLSESKYQLMIDDGLTDLAVSVVNVFENAKLNKEFIFVDLNGKKLPIPKSKLWLSGGWRNPERNEWYSNALNGIHQRGGAIDLVANEPHSDKRSAIVYWFLWKALRVVKLDAFWQLETRGRPMTTREFIEDIEPRNGVPDAFDKADHIHINIKYK